MKIVKPGTASIIPCRLTGVPICAQRRKNVYVFDGAAPLRKKERVRDDNMIYPSPPLLGSCNPPQQ
jgi:hypothetical protein